MSGGSWKVAYADFMTAMMAFFLLMWLINSTTPEQKAGLADFFSADATGEVNITSPIGPKLPTSVQHVDKLDTREFNPSDINESHQAIIQALKQSLADNMNLSAATGRASYNPNGVLMNLTPNVLFQPNSISITPAGEGVLEDVVAIMEKYKVYLVVRGHADKNEHDIAGYKTTWDISAARANTVVQRLIDLGVNEKHIRSIAYADTNPLIPSSLPGAAEANSRVEFNFHRPEVMSTISGF